MEGQQNAGKRVRNGNQMDCDRLSNLPDPIINHILSLMDTTYAVRTCVLSKKWKQYWTEIQSLNFDYEPCYKVKNLEQLIRHVLRKRRQFSLRRLSFINRSRSQSLATRILNYCRSYNVEELETNSNEICSQLSKLPNLRILKVFHTVISNSTHFGSSLTTLCLTRVQFDCSYRYCDVFSSCLMLENLFLNRWDVDLFDDLKVSTPKLINLTISSLKSLNYRQTSKLVISAPSLKFFDFSGAYVTLSGIDECLVLETVKIKMYPITSKETEDMKQGHALYLLRMAERLSHVKSAKISWNFSETCRGNFILDHQGP